MSNVDHYAVLRNYFNPSDNLTPGATDRRYAGFRPDVDIMSQVFTSDMVSIRTDEGVAFKMDHHYYALFVATRWPSMTDPTISHILTKRLNKDYWIAVNIYPLTVQGEIRKEESELRKIALDATKAGNRSMLESMNMKQQKIDALMRGYTFPFKVTYVVGVFDRDLDGLIEKCASLKGAFQDMNGMQAHMCNEPAQMKNLMMQVIPGWTAGPVRQWDLYASSDYLPDMLPASTTFTGHLLSGETLNRGAESNLVGTQSFANGMTQHGALLGINGAGKSVSTVDWLLQSEPIYEFTAIIEEGLSYGIYTAAVGGTTIVITPGGRECINYLDTLGLPLSAESRALSVALCMKMVGNDPNPQRNNAYRALIGDYINRLYAECVEDFVKQLDDDEKHEIWREAYTLWTYMSTQGSMVSTGGDPLIDAFTELRDKRKEDADWYSDYTAQFDEASILAWSQERDGKVFIRNYAVSRFSHEDYVKFGLRHSALVDKLRNAASTYHEDSDRKYVGNMLAGWTAGDGANGGLFDGATNIRLDGGLVKAGDRNRHQVVHFELGYIPEAAGELRNAAGFLVSTLHSTAHHHAAARTAQTFHFRGTGKVPQRRRRTENRVRSVRSVAQIQHAGDRRFPKLRGDSRTSCRDDLFELEGVLPDAPEERARPGRDRQHHRSADDRAPSYHAVPADGAVRQGREGLQLDHVFRRIGQRNDVRSLPRLRFARDALGG